MEIKQIDVLIKDIIGNDQENLSSELTKWLDFSKDKWAARLVLVQLYLLGEKLNDFTAIQVSDMIYKGTSELPSLLEILAVTNWTNHLNGRLENQLMEDSTFIKGQAGARNIPNELASKKIFLQPNGKNLEFTPIGKNLVKALFTLCLKNSGINLSTLVKILSQKSIEKDLLHAILLPELDIPTGLNLKLLEIQKNDEKITYFASSITQEIVEFILDHPYLDSSSTIQIKEHFQEILIRNYWNYLKYQPPELYQSKNKPVGLELNKIFPIHWIYQLKPREYKYPAELKWMFRNKNDYDVNSDPKLSFKTIILEAGPGTGKSVWMLQQTEKILSDLKESPFIFQLKDFSLLQKDQIKWLSFKDALIVSLSDDLSNPKEIMYTLLNCVNDENASIFWIKTYMKILQSTHFFLLLDGWDELEPNLKPFFLKLIQYIETQPIFKFTIIISTRFLDNELLSLKQDPPKTELENYFPKNSNIYSLNEPEIPQSIQYLQNKGVKTIVDQKSLEKLKKMLGDKLTPMDLWILGLFPKIEDLPSNRAQLFDRWIKYEILLEYQEKMQGPLGEITNILELDKFLNSEIFIERTADKSSFSLIQLVEGPVCSVTPKTDKEDYALSILLPRLVYNRIQNADYTYNYDRIIQANPLFRRFLHKVMDKNFHPNFRLQNPHYDYYLSACHCFNIYLAGNNFKFLDKPEMETFFREILVNNKKRRDRDLIHNFSDEYILLRNKMEIIPAFNPESIGYPINQAGPIIFETDMNNFIDPFKDQLYKFYWEKYTQFSDDLSNDELVTNFKNVSLSLTNRIDSIFDVIGDILTFQHKNYEQKKPLNDYIKKIELETPFIIPIIIHAFRFSENDYISREWIEKLEQHPFMDYPWIKLWIFREIIQWAPNRICDLAVYAKEHTYSYILKFCCCNIIPPQIPGIEEQNFSLSIDLFQKIQKTRYKEIILFHWASHYLTDAQLKTLQKLEAEIYEKESFQLDFKYLLILHGIMPKSFYFSDLNKITPQKCYQFLLALFWLQKNSLKPIQFELKDSNKTNILYLHQFCLEKSEKDLDDYEKKEEFFPPDFQKIIIEQCQNWWKEHMPCSHSALEEYFEHIGKILKNSSIFSKRNENLNELFTLKQYFIRFSQFEIQDRNIVFDLGKELIQKLLQEEMTDKSHHFEKTQLNEFLEIFLEWVLKCQTSSEFVDVLILFNNHPLKTIEKFILKGLSAYPNDWGIKNDIQTRIRSNFSEYVNEPHWNKHRKDHPKDLDENFSIGKKSSLIRFIPVVEAINLLTTHYNFSNFNPAHFNFLSSDEDDDEDEKNKTPSLENLFYFVHNLAVLEKPEAYKTIAQFWDRLYVNYTCYASQDPSFFIWCGIPYEKLEEVYQYLTNPIAKIFYLVCLSISDRYKPKKLDIKHSNFDTGSFIRNLIQEFPSTQIKQTLVEFLSADWTLDYYEFLFYFTEFDLDLASLILARVSDGKFKLSRILFQTKKNSIEQKRYNFLENYFDRFQPMIIDYLKQFMTIASQYVKKEILNVLISSQNQDAIRLASDWWENYDIIMKFPISIEKFFEIFQSVNNCVFLEKFVSVHGEFFFVHSYITPKAKLNACFKNLNTLYVYFCQKLITHNIINFKPRNDDLSRQIEEFYRRYYKIRREWHIFNTTQMRFYEILKTASGRKINDLISTRFPFFNRNYGDLSSLNLKLNELTKLTIDFQNTPEIMEILKKKIADYENTKNLYYKEKIKPLDLPKNADENLISTDSEEDSQEDQYTDLANESKENENLKNGKFGEFWRGEPNPLNKERYDNLGLEILLGIDFDQLNSSFQEITFENSDLNLKSFFVNLKKNTSRFRFIFKLLDIITSNQFEKLEGILNFISEFESDVDKELESEYDRIFEFFEPRIVSMNEDNESLSDCYPQLKNVCDWLNKEEFNLEEFLKIAMNLDQNLELSALNTNIFDLDEYTFYTIAIPNEKKLKIRECILFLTFLIWENNKTTLSHDTSAYGTESGDVYEDEIGITLDRIFNKVISQVVMNDLLYENFQILQKYNRPDLIIQAKNYLLLNPILEFCYEYKKSENNSNLYLFYKTPPSIEKALTSQEIWNCVYLHMGLLYFRLQKAVLNEITDLMNGYKIHPQKRKNPEIYSYTEDDFNFDFNT